MSEQNLEASSWWEQYRTSVQTGTTHEIELLLRSPAPSLGGHDRRKQIFDRVESAVESDLLDGYETTVVGEKLCLCRRCAHTPVGTRLLQKLALLKDWGDDTKRPESFDEREVESSITGETYRVLVPPEICLSVTVDDSIEGVFPCTIDGVPYDVISYLDALVAEPVRPQTAPIDMNG